MVKMCEKKDSRDRRYSASLLVSVISEDRNRTARDG